MKHNTACIPSRVTGMTQLCSIRMLCLPLFIIKCFFLSFFIIFLCASPSFVDSSSPALTPSVNESFNPSNSIVFDGVRFAEATFIDPFTEYQSCVTAPLIVPNEWIIADAADPRSQLAASSRPWGASCMVLSDGSSVYTNNGADCGSNTLSVETIDGSYSVSCTIGRNGIHRRLLISATSRAILGNLNPLSSVDISETNITKFITFQGVRYAVLDNADPHSDMRRGYGCQQSFMKMPTGWNLVDFSIPALQAIAGPGHLFGTACLILKSGASIDSFLPSTYCSNDNLWTLKNHYKPKQCSSRILISQFAPAQEQDSWITQFSISNKVVTRGMFVATLDNGRILNGRSSECQMTSLKLPAEDGWSVATDVSHFISDLQTRGLWFDTECLVDFSGHGYNRKGILCGTNLLAAIGTNVNPSSTSAFFAPTSCNMRILITKPVTSIDGLGGINSDIIALDSYCMLWGFGHFVTFDHLYYTMGSPGEYVVIKTSSTGTPSQAFELQIRTETLFKQPHASITAFSVKYSSAPILTIGINKESRIPWIMVNGMHISRQALPFNLGGNPNRVVKLIQRNYNDILFYVSLEANIAITFECYGNPLLPTLLRVNMKSTYVRSIYGLCGNYDGFSSNDFVVPNIEKQVNVDVFNPDSIVSWANSVFRGQGLFIYQNNTSDSYFFPTWKFTDLSSFPMVLRNLAWTACASDTSLIQILVEMCSLDVAIAESDVISKLYIKVSDGISYNQSAREFLSGTCTVNPNGEIITLTDKVVSLQAIGEFDLFYPTSSVVEFIRVQIRIEKSINNAMPTPVPTISTPPKPGTPTTAPTTNSLSTITGTRFSGISVTDVSSNDKISITYDRTSAASQSINPVPTVYINDTPMMLIPLNVPIYLQNSQNFIVKSSTDIKLNFGSNLVLRVFFDSSSKTLSQTRGYLYSHIFLPDTYRQRSSGLCGTWDSLQPAHEFTNRDSSIIRATSDSQINAWALGYLVPLQESLFTYIPGTSYVTYLDTKYVPAFVGSYSSAQISLAKTHCSSGNFNTDQLRQCSMMYLWGVDPAVAKSVVLWSVIADNVVLKSISSMGASNDCRAAVTPTNWITSQGFDYALLDGTDPLNSNILGCQVGGFSLPQGWTLVDDNVQARLVLPLYTWGTTCVSIGTGASPLSYNSNIGVCPQSATIRYIGSSLQCIAVTACPMRVLIYRRNLETKRVENSECSPYNNIKDVHLNWIPYGTGFEFQKTSNDVDGNGYIILISVPPDITNIVASATQSVFVNQMVAEPICFSAYSQAFASVPSAQPSEWVSLYADVLHQDGSHSYRMTYPLNQNQPNWVQSILRIDLSSPIKWIYLSLYVANTAGNFLFDDITEYPYCNNLVLNSGFDTTEMIYPDPPDVSDSVRKSILNRINYLAVPQAYLWRWNGPGGYFVTADCSRGKFGYGLSMISTTTDTVYAAEQKIVPTIPMSTSFLMISGWSKSIGVSGLSSWDYSVYADIFYTDGTILTGRNAPFSTPQIPGQIVDWHQVSTGIPTDSTKRIQQISIFAMFRYKLGNVCFDDFSVNYSAVSTNYGKTSSSKAISLSSPITPQTALFGDPHILTIDGIFYDVQGKGEYLLYNDGTFSIQARFSDEHGATVCSGVAMHLMLPASNVTAIPTRPGREEILNGNSLSVSLLRAKQSVAAVTSPSLFFNGIRTSTDNLAILLSGTSSLMVNIRGGLGDSANPLTFDLSFIGATSLYNVAVITYLSSISNGTSSTQHFLLSIRSPIIGNNESNPSPTVIPSPNVTPISTSTPRHLYTMNSAKSQGLLGNANQYSSDDLSYIPRQNNGKLSYLDPKSIDHNSLYSEFLEFWTVPFSLSLFPYVDGNTQQSVRDSNFYSIPINILAYPVSRRESAKALCGGAGLLNPFYDACIFDILVTGDTSSYIYSARQAQKTYLGNLISAPIHYLDPPTISSTNLVAIIVPCVCGVLVVILTIWGCRRCAIKDINIKKQTIADPNFKGEAKGTRRAFASTDESIMVSKLNEEDLHEEDKPRGVKPKVDPANLELTKKFIDERKREMLLKTIQKPRMINAKPLDRDGSESDEERGEINNDNIEMFEDTALKPDISRITSGRRVYKRRAPAVALESATGASSVSLLTADIDNGGEDEDEDNDDETDVLIKTNRKRSTSRSRSHSQSRRQPASHSRSPSRSSRPSRSPRSQSRRSSSSRSRSDSKHRRSKSTKSRTNDISSPIVDSDLLETALQRQGSSPSLDMQHSSKAVTKEERNMIKVSVEEEGNVDGKGLVRTPSLTTPNLNREIDDSRAARRKEWKAMNKLRHDDVQVEMTTRGLNPSLVRPPVDSADYHRALPSNAAKPSDALKKLGF